MRKIKPLHLGIITFLLISVFIGYIKSDWSIPRQIVVVTVVMYGVTIIFKRKKRL